MHEREYWATLQAADGRKIRVVLIESYKSDSPQLAGFPVMSASSGPKDYLKNEICTLLEKADEVFMVRGRGPMFAILRRGHNFFDISGEKVGITYAAQS